MAIKNPETDATEDDTENQKQKCDFEKFEGIVSVFELQILCFLLWTDTLEVAKTPN